MRGDMIRSAGRSVQRAGSRGQRPAHALLAGLAFFVGGCGDVSDDIPRYTDDLDSIRARGELRILAPSRLEAGGLPRESSPLQLERRLAEAFAVREGLTPSWVLVDEYSDLIPALTEGRGDMIVANFAVTPERDSLIAFGQPVAHAFEHIVTHQDSQPISTPRDLAGRVVTVRRSSSYWKTLDSLRQEIPELQVVAAPEDHDTEELLHQVAKGVIDVTLADDLIVEMAQSYLPELRADAVASAQRSLAWGVRKENTALLEAVSQFTQMYNPPEGRPNRYTGDLPAITERRVLRVLTRNNAASYFVMHGHILGFEHDLAIEFAKRLGLTVEFVTAPTRAALFAWLVDGRADVVAASITLRDDMPAGIAYSRDYNRVVETVVARTSDSTLQELNDLTGRTIAVRQSSSYWQTIARLRRQGLGAEVVAVPEEMETEEIIHRVATGEYDLTIADSHILDIELSWRDDVRGAFSVGDTVSHAWMVRGSEPELLAAVNSYFDEVHRTEFYNITHRKYFGSRRAAQAHATSRATLTGVLSPFDDLTQRYSNRYDFDWVTIAAQMYEESRFNPDAVSFAGAVGLMQVMPTTARGFGFDSITVPEVNVHAGTRYLRHVYRLLEEIPDSTERLWFALASYNAGYGHIQDARRLAEQEGLNPNLWFGNVAEVAPLLTRREYHRQTEHGYCRCTEPVAYVRKIRERQKAYEMAVGQR